MYFQRVKAGEMARSLKIRKARTLVSDTGKANIRIKSSVGAYYVPATEFGWRWGIR